MLDFVLFAATAIIGLLILLYFAMKDSPENSGKKVAVKPIPRWSTPPADDKLGDFGELAKYGSLHQYLMHLHGNGEVPVTSFWWGNTQVVSVCNAQAFKELVGLTNRPELLFKGFEPLIGPGSIQYANNEDWEMRQKCLYQTLKGRDLQSYFPLFVAIAKEADSSWSQYSESDKVALGNLVFHMTIKGIARSCLGDVFDDDKEVEKLSSCYHDCWREMEVRITHGEPEEGSERAKKFEASRGQIMDIVRKLIQSCKEGGGDKDVPHFIDSMLRNYSSEDTITSDVVSFLVGGFHTSGYLMTWMIWYLAIHQDSQQRLLEEVQQEVGGDSEDKLKDYAYSSNTFMRQVEDETLRLSTLAPWGARYADEDITVCGYKVPAGVPIITALGVALKNTTQWNNVDEWNPDRFSAASVHGKRGNEFCPFGIHSKRKCPGYLFSYFEVSIFIAFLIQRYKFVAVEGQEVESVYGLVTEPKNEIYIHLHRR